MNLILHCRKRIKLFQELMMTKNTEEVRQQLTALQNMNEEIDSGDSEEVQQLTAQENMNEKVDSGDAAEVQQQPTAQENMTEEVDSEETS